MNITEYQVELVKDPFRILSGKRYEFLLDLELDEEDELYSPHGIYVKAVYVVEESGGRIVKHELYERTTNRFLDYDLEDDELAEAEAFCANHYKEADE